MVRWEAHCWKPDRNQLELAFRTIMHAKCLMKFTRSKSDVNVCLLNALSVEIGASMIMKL